jgi:RPA family protein
LVGLVDFEQVDVNVSAGSSSKKADELDVRYFVLKNEEDTMRRVQALQKEMKPIERDEIEKNYQVELRKKKKEAEQEAFEASSISNRAKSFAREGRRGHKKR